MSKKDRVERVIAERIVGEKVLGSANPIAMGFRHGGKSIIESVQGVVVGFLLFLVAIYASTCDVQRHSGEVAKLTPVAAEKAAGLSGMQIVTGIPESIENIVAPLTDRKVIYYRYVKEEYVTEPVTETKTETVVENGKEKEVTKEVTKEVSDWKTIDEKTDYSDLKLGALTIKPDGAKIDVPSQNTEKSLGKNKNGNDERETVSYIPVTGPLTVLGEVSGDTISGGVPFRITTEKPENLVKTMKGEEKAGFLMYKILAIALFTISFTLMLGPILLLIGVVPVIGGIVRFFIFVASLVIAIVLVSIITIVAKFWWVFILAAVAVTFFAVAGSRRHHQSHAGT